MKKLISIIAGIILSLTTSCNDISNLPPNLPTPPTLDPILSQEKERLYITISKRGEIVADSVEKNYPEGLVVYLKGETIEKDRYLALRVLKGKFRTLELTIYRLPDELPPEIKKELSESYLSDQTPAQIFYKIGAKQTLDKIYNNRMVIHDLEINGLGEAGDYLKTTNRGGLEITLKEGILIRGTEIDKIEEPALSNFLDKANGIYSNNLVTLTSE